MVLRPSILLFAATLLIAGCGKNIKSKEKVEEAIIDRLRARSGLDLNVIEVTTTSVSFDKNMAYATVAFHPKDNPNVHSGMTMRYTLEARDGKWVVVNVGDSQGHGIGGSSSMDPGQLPPGHPPVGSSAPPR